MMNVTRQVGLRVLPTAFKKITTTSRDDNCKASRLANRILVGYGIMTASSIAGVCWQLRDAGIKTPDVKQAFASCNTRIIYK
jgi:hypothetical protein